MSHKNENLHSLSDFNKEDQNTCSQEVLNLKFPHSFAPTESTKVHNSIKASTLLTYNQDNTVALNLCNNQIVCLDSRTLSTQYTFEPHLSTILNLKFSKDNPHHLLSSCQKGSIILWDVRTGTQCNQWINDKPITSFDVSRNGRFLCAGTEVVNSEAYLLFWDIRSSKELGGYWNCHSNDITCVQYSPHYDDVVASSSLDSLLNVYDTSLGEEDDALIHSIPNDEMIHSFRWSPTFKDGIMCFSADHSIQYWDVRDIAPLKSYSREDLTRNIYREVASECYVVPTDSVDSNEFLIVVGSGLEHLKTSCLRVLKYNSSEGTLVPYALFKNYLPEITQSILYIERFGRFISVAEDATVTTWHLESHKEERITKKKKNSTKKPY